MSLAHAYQKTVSKKYILDYLDLFLGTMIVVGGDFNAHVGERSPEYLEEHGQHIFGVRNKEEERLLKSL